MTGPEINIVNYIKLIQWLFFSPYICRIKTLVFSNLTVNTQPQSVFLNTQFKIHSAGGKPPDPRSIGGMGNSQTSRKRALDYILLRAHRSPRALDVACQLLSTQRSQNKLVQSNFIYKSRALSHQLPHSSLQPFLTPRQSQPTR